MTRVQIFDPDDPSINAGKLDALLHEADCEAVESLEQADALIVIITSDLFDNNQLESILMKAVNADMCIVGIWPTGATSGSIPAALEKYASAHISWDPVKLREAVSCERDDQFDNPDGTQRHGQHTDRNQC